MSIELSVVIPFLNEEESLARLRESFAGLQGLPSAHEIIFVSDGSTDRSVEVVADWLREDPRIRLIELTRNFGHQAAICAGMDFAKGKFVGVMDADLQDSPELLVRMHETAVRENWDIVFCARGSRRGFWLKRLSYWIFYRLYGYLAEIPIDADGGDFCVMSRKAVRALESLPERVRFVRGLRSWTGLRSKAIRADRPDRAAGRPQYSWGKLIRLALDGVTSFSVKPLRIATFFGALLCAGSMILTLVYIASWFVFQLHSRIPGFTTIVILILFLSGAQFLMMGIIGEYIAQIFWEVKRRPTYLVGRALNLPAEDDGRDHPPL